MQERPYKAYAMVDEKGRIMEIRSDAFGESTDGLVLLGEGWGDKYHHAQGNFLPKPLMDERGIYRYKLVDGQVVERTQEEMDADWVVPEPVITDKERIAALEKDNADLKEALELLLSGVME